jgi:hypothetical protein
MRHLPIGAVATIATVVMVAVLAPQPAGAKALRYGCACVGTPWAPNCGSSHGLGGNHGQINRDIPAGQILPFYTPGAFGPGMVPAPPATGDTEPAVSSPWSLRGQASGWSCLPEAAYNCACTGTEASPNCGNGAVTGTSGETRIALSLGDVLKNYGPGRIGPERTGWVCIPTAIQGGD